ncbi:MAG: type II secretion system F family protein [Clostridiales bacterium]|nr:type II secretion system F family protein [Clostridiales bacterium]
MTLDIILGIVFLSISVLVSLIFIILLLSSEEYDEYIAPLDHKDFIFVEIFGVGFKLLKIIKFQYKTSIARKTRDQINALYGEKYADYYLQVYYAQKISLSYFSFAAISAVAAMMEGTNRILFFVIAIVVAFVVYYFYSLATGRKIKTRSEQFALEFPNAVSTIALLVNSGMILRDAWKEVAFSNESLLSFEMRRVNEDISNGIAESDAFYSFANRCVTPEIKKFTSIVIQGLEKGSKDLAAALENQNRELWESKKQKTLKKGELASNKLLIPLLIMFFGVLVLVIVPVISNLGL